MNNKRDAMGDRFKEYEAVSNIKLTRRTPVILRLDMCQGHTFTKGFDKPFDKTFDLYLLYAAYYEISL